MKTFIAKQVPSEDCESPLMTNYFEVDENYVSIMPERNGCYSRAKPDEKMTTEIFRKALAFLVEHAENADDLRKGEYEPYLGYMYEKTTTADLLHYYFERDFSEEEQEKALECMDAFCEARSYEEASIVAEFLSLVEKRDYKSAEIRGCCQGDWAQIVYDSGMFGAKFVEYFEKEYFNTGDEYMVYPLDNPDNTTYVYTHDWSEAGKIAEIRDAIGASDEDEIKIAEFIGYKKIPQWKEAV